MDTEKRCLFCGSRNLTMKKARFVPFLEERMFCSDPKETLAVHCKNCDFWFSSYRPDEEEMTRLYSGYRDEHYQKQRQKYEPYYTEEFNFNLGHNAANIVSRKMFLEKLIKKHLIPEKITKVLDYGGDNGQFIPDCFSKAEKFVYEVSNVPTIEGVSNISEEDIIKNCDFDFVMCCHVLEHVPYPAELIKKLCSYCKEAGYIYLEVPYEAIPFAGNYIHEHISVYSTRTFLELWTIQNDVDLIETSNSSGVIYVLMKKRHNLPVVRYLKKYTAIIRLTTQKHLNKFVSILNRLRIIYYLNK